MSRILMSMDRTGDHELKLVFYDTSTEGFDPVFEHKIAPKDQGDFMASVANLVSVNLRDVAQDMARGDCPTCRNLRLVDVEVNGRMSNKSCPDCMGKGQDSAFEHYPIVGGGLAPRKKEES